MYSQQISLIYISGKLVSHGTKLGINLWQKIKNLRQWLKGWWAWVIESHNLLNDVYGTRCVISKLFYFVMLSIVHWKKTRTFLSRLKSTLFVARHIDLFHWALWSEEGKIFQVCRSTKSFFFNTICLLKPFFPFMSHHVVYIERFTFLAF